MKRLSVAACFIAAIITGNVAEAAPYIKIDLGWNEIRSKFNGTADSVALDTKAHRPHGGLVGVGVGSQLGDYRVELMVNLSRNHRTLHLSSDEMKVRLHRFAGMVNVYYDHYVGIVSPYAMAGLGTVMHKARIKHTGGEVMNLRAARGLVGHGGLGLMVRATESVSVDFGLRAGHERFKKGRTITNKDPNNNVHAKYGVFYTMLIGLQVKM